MVGRESGHIDGDKDLTRVLRVVYMCMVVIWSSRDVAVTVDAACIFLFQACIFGDGRSNNVDGGPDPVHIFRVTRGLWWSELVGTLTAYLNPLAQFVSNLHRLQPRAQQY